MAERKFTRVLSKPGSAAQVRETVSQAVRESTVLTKPRLVEPLDFETFLTKNRTVLQNDPQREMLLFPFDDVSQVTVPRSFRTFIPAIPEKKHIDSSLLFVRECIKTYTADWKTVNYKYQAYSGTYFQLPRLPKASDLQDHVYEVDTETETKDSSSTCSSTAGVVKEGYILKGPESGMESFISLATKSFKRRYMTLKPQVDGTHILEFHKDDRKGESKGTICLDFCNNVIRNSKRGKLNFELQLSDGHKPCILAAESECELEEWIVTLKDIITNSKNNSWSSSRKSTISSIDTLTPPISTSGYGTLRGLEHSKNPELVKFARETDFSVTQARKENRQNVFSVYPEMQKPPSYPLTDSETVEPLKEEFGIRIYLKCEEIKFKLQAPLESERNTLCQVEPYITTLAIYDVKQGLKVTEDFRFDANHSYIRNMLPKSGRKGSIPNSSPANHMSTNNPINNATDALSLNGLSEEWLLYPKQAIVTVSQASPDLVLVVRIEKVLQGGINQSVEPYLRPSAYGDIKQGNKVQKQVRACCQRLGHYRMPFAWAARPLFKRYSGELDTSTTFNPIYRQECSKLSDDDMIKFITDLRRPDKLKHLIVIPGHIKIHLKLLHDTISNTLTSSLVPVNPFPLPPTHDPTLEVEVFPSGSDYQPFSVYKNLLYVFPKGLKFDNQKSFTKARNIGCAVELRDSDAEDSKPIKCIFGRPGEPSFVTQSVTAVTHHCTTPDFYEEVKINLPCNVTEKHHLLFKFYHISCEPPKGSKRRDCPVETVVGYAWMPLFCKGRLMIEEVSLSVATHLPARYLSHQPLGLGKGFSGPEIRFVDNGNKIFRVSLKLISTVYTSDLHLNNFVVHCQKLLENKLTGQNGSETSTLLKFIPPACHAQKLEDSLVDDQQNLELSIYVKALHAVDISTMIGFLPTILNLLFRLLVMETGEEVSLNTVRVLIHIVHSVHEAGKAEILHSYVQYAFSTELNQKTTVHEELTKALTIMLRPANTDFLVINKFLQDCNFFFQILLKSMAQYLLSTEKIKMHRHERFSSDYQYRIQTLLQTLVPHILQKYRDLPLETRKANQSLAHFLKKCLTLMDRGFIFRLISFYLEKFGPGDTRVLHEYKFEFLEILCSHEHFVALNLPLMRGSVSRGYTRNIKDFEQEYHLSEEFCRHHFLVGLLLQEVRAALSEVHEFRLIAITVLRNLLAKHAFDDRFQGKSQQARLTSLYLPFISILLENIQRLNSGNEPCSPTSKKTTSGSPSSLSIFKTSVPPTPTANPPTLSSVASSPSSEAATRRNTVSMDGTGSLPGSLRNTRDSTYLSIIAGQGQKCNLPLKSASTGKNGSCNSVTSSASSAASDHTTKESSESPSRDDDRSTTSKGHLRYLGQSVCDDQVDDMDFDRVRMQFLKAFNTLFNRSQSLPFNNPTMVRFDKLDSAEVKDLLVCFLYIVKNINEELLIGWWQHCSESDTLDFFHLLEICLHQFKYMGKKHITLSRTQFPERAPNGTSQPKAMTLPARTAPPSFNHRCNSTYNETPTKSRTLSDQKREAPSPSEADILFRALLEANMATEVGLTALDILGLYTQHFRKQLILNDGDNVMMKKLFDIYMSFLQVGQSETLVKHLFAALRGFLNKFSTALFQGSATLCGKLCFELLRCCDSKLNTVRNEACALLYLLMRSNFEFTERQGMTRVHLQLIVSVSRLLGEVIGLNNARFQESLSIICKYADSDKVMQNSGFPLEVKDLTKRIRTVLMATAQMREHENDPEMLVDLQHSLANSYQATPALRETWLQSMARMHMKNDNLSEAAQCYLHVAALEAEYLKSRGVIQGGCKAFKSISPNIEQDESNMKEDTGVQDVQYTEDTLLERLQNCVELLHQAERYEVMAEVYKLIIPILERRKDFEELANCYKTLHTAYCKIVEVMQTGRRLLGRYYRVAFFGEAYFESDSGKEYIYKEPKVTSLVEISERLNNLFSDKFGKESVKMIMDSIQVDPHELDPKYAYIQVTHAMPYFEEGELETRQTEFERNHNLRKFMFETPFTQDPQRARGTPEEQWKRRTILSTLYSFPYVKKRIAVSSKTIYQLQPIEVAIDEMKTRVQELHDVVLMEPTDMKKLQLKLQGSICVQVNAGPLAYAKAFLDGNKVLQHPPEHVVCLRETYRQFLSISQDALELNGKLITSDQYEYHAALKDTFDELVDSLTPMLQDKVTDGKEKSQSKRTSLEVFNFISGSPGSSTV